MLSLLTIGVVALGMGATAGVIFALGCMKAFEAISDIFHGDLQRGERMDRISLFLLAKGLLAIGAAAIGVGFFRNVALTATGIAISFGLVLLLEARFAPTPIHLRWSWPPMRRLSLLGLPLGLAMMLISLNLNLPRYFVERSLGAYSLGIFAALGYLSVAASTLVNALGLAATPRLSMLFGAGRLGEFLQMLLWSCAGAAVLVSAGIGILLWFGRPLLSLVYGAPYAAHLDVAIWVAAATGLSCMASVFGFGLTAARAFRPQLPLFVVVTLATAFAAYVLVPRYGLIGAAASQVVSAVVQLLGSAGLLLLQCRQKAESLTLVPEAVA